MTEYLNKSQVVYLNAILIRRFSPSEDIGIKDLNLLDSAINYSRQSAFGEDAYPTIFEKAAALFQSLAQNHPFYNANKRTAYAALELFLRKNGYVILAEQKQKEDLTVELSDQQNNISVHDVSIWIEEHSSPYSWRHKSED
ncbi:type II toxin-antitoxin system death-on-curing family toxin [Sporolactobacillus laevolacticus]|uniref:type II toxin-antitoxin system death-on-curing family toxin n=1 Tax=Sporolactobacillus laevolacticus TaxID=33018 RepID=UPI0025B4807D|nr:type II toxin-antitoxin system death-on-curing family toxin [Sporolactobacillus laevolacticus]MDN3955947.1 type II toxin-antitoxin system death-on-curing family toxin [Sporolactobacillus laevolacticus]